MSEMLLLGAGASIEANVPGAYAMTEDIVHRFRQDSGLRKHAHVIAFVAGGLMFQQGIRGESPYDGVNVEELFNAVQLLAGRRTLEAAPFVGSWHTMVEEFDKVNPPRPRLDRVGQVIYDSVSKEILAAFSQHTFSSESSDIDRKLENAVKKIVEAVVKGRSASLSSSDSVGGAVAKFVERQVDRWESRLKNARPNSHDLERELTQAIEGRETKHGEGRIYETTNELLIRTLTEIVWINDAQRVQHLQPILHLLETQQRLVVATLNYDNGIELLAQSCSVPCRTGIEEWSQHGTFDMSGEGLHLLKLHGSIDWSLERGQQGNGKPMPHSVIHACSPDQVRQGRYRPGVIFGQRNKLTAEGPFLEMLRAFQRELSQADCLTVVGYSFRDPHINEFVSRWINTDNRNILRIIDPSFEHSTVEYAQQLRRHCAQNLNIFSEKAGDGLAKAFAPATKKEIALPPVRSSGEIFLEKIEPAGEVL